MKKAILLLFFIYANLLLADSTLVMKVGDTRIITLPNISKVSIGNPKVADVITISKQELFVMAKGLGNTMLYVWGKGKRYIYNIIVSNNSLQSKIKEAIGRDIDIIMARDMIILKGVVRSEDEKNIAEEIAKVYSDKVTNLLRIAVNKEKENTENYMTIEEEVQSLIGLPNVKVKIRGESLILDGEVNNQNDFKRAQKIAEVYSNKVINLLKIKSPYQIVIEGKIIDISETSVKNLGIQWAGRLGEGVYDFIEKRDVNLTSSDNFKIGSIVRNTDIYATLKALIEEGKARIISSPRLMTLSGQRAELNVGGQVPIRKTSITDGIVTESFEYYDYGLNVNITPEVDVNGDIKMDINISISDVSFGNVKDSNNNVIPQFLNRSAHSMVSCYNGQTIVISGLIRHENNRTRNRVPFLSRIPGLGKIFHNKIDRFNSSELLIVLTPHLIKNDKETVVTKKGTIDDKKEVEKDLRKIIYNMNLSKEERRKKIFQIFNNIKNNYN